MLSIRSKILPTKTYYPSVTEHILLKAIEHAKLYTSITQQELDIILRARKSLLFSKNKPWEKTIKESLFDITMGSYDGAEICMLVGLYILSIFGKVYVIQNVVSTGMMVYLTCTKLVKQLQIKCRKIS